MSYVQCLWSPLLSDWGVLNEPFATVVYPIASSLV